MSESDKAPRQSNTHGTEEEARLLKAQERIVELELALAKWESDAISPSSPRETVEFVKSTLAEQIAVAEKEGAIIGAAIKESIERRDRIKQLDTQETPNVYVEHYEASEALRKLPWYKDGRNDAEREAALGRLDNACEAVEAYRVTAPLSPLVAPINDGSAHLDHPLRHFDRTCLACWQEAENDAAVSHTEPNEAEARRLAILDCALMVNGRLAGREEGSDLWLEIIKITNMLQRFSKSDTGLRSTPAPKEPK